MNAYYAGIWIFEFSKKHLFIGAVESSGQALTLSFFNV